MAAPETIESITPKLGATLTTLRQVEQLYLEAVRPGCRMLYQLCEWMPLGVIPLALIWSGVIMFVPVHDPMRLILVFALGLLTLLVSVGTLFAARMAINEIHLKDHVLADIAAHTSLAYHPNSVLRRCVARHGHATLGEFRVWLRSQREILNNRANDYAATLDALRRGPATCRVEQIQPGAKTFLES